MIGSNPSSLITPTMLEDSKPILRYLDQAVMQVRREEWNEQTWEDRFQAAMEHARANMNTQHHVFDGDWRPPMPEGEGDDADRNDDAA